MKLAVLAGALIGGRIAIALLAPSSFTLGGWLTAAALMVLALVGRSVALHQTPDHAAWAHQCSDS